MTVKAAVLLYCKKRFRVILINISAVLNFTGRVVDITIIEQMQNQMQREVGGTVDIHILVHGAALEIEVVLGHGR